MASTLPKRIVACLLGLAGRVSAWAEAHPDAPLAEQEWAVLGLVRASLPMLLEAGMFACTPELSEPGRGVPRVREGPAAARAAGARGADGVRGGDVRARLLLLPGLPAGLGAGRRGPGAGALPAGERAGARVGGLAGGGDGVPRGRDLAGEAHRAGIGGGDDPRPRRGGR